MRSKLILILAAVGLPSFAYAQAKAPAHAQAHTSAHTASRPASAPPKPIGKFDEWQAATHQEGGQQVCYAFTLASSSLPALPGRGGVVLTVTERTGGRDTVAISAGFAYAPGTEVQMGVDQTQLAFYTAGRSAFARDGKAAVAAFEKGRQAVAKSPGPRNAAVSDSFSLRGFSPAYAAISKACPAK